MCLVELSNLHVEFRNLYGSSNRIFYLTCRVDCFNSVNQVRYKYEVYLIIPCYFRRLSRLSLKTLNDFTQRSVNWTPVFSTPRVQLDNSESLLFLLLLILQLILKISASLFNYWILDCIHMRCFFETSYSLMFFPIYYLDFIPEMQMVSLFLPYFVSHIRSFIFTS